jgi:hypothetical protein
MIEPDRLAAAWSLAAERARQMFAPDALPSRWDVREALRSIGVAASPATVAAECERAGLRLADA